MTATHFASVRSALIQGRPVPDVAFDAVYPQWAKEASARFWTPVRVAMLAGTWLRSAGARAVLDVGSGVGKFAVVAALSAGLDITGVEHRTSSVATARQAAAQYRASAQFVCATIEQIDPKAYDALYLFNPFGENLVDPEERLDHSVTLDATRYQRDVALVERWLEEAPPGSSMVSYNGFGGRIPDSYSLIRSHRTGRLFVRLWTKTVREVSSLAFVELRGRVVTVPTLRRADAAHTASRPQSGSAPTRRPPPR